MSTHRECGAQITWARRPGEHARYFPPLEYAGHAFVIDYQSEGGPTAREVSTYTIHECDPAAAEAFMRRQEEQRQIITAAENIRLSQYEYALQRDCTRCTAVEGEMCYNLTDFRRDGTKTPTRYPHRERTMGWEPEGRL